MKRLNAEEFVAGLDINVAERPGLKSTAGIEALEDSLTCGLKGQLVLVVPHFFGAGGLERER